MILFLLKDDVRSRAEIKLCGLAVRVVGKLSPHKLSTGLIVRMRTPVELNVLARVNCPAQIKASPGTAQHLGLNPNDVHMGTICHEK